MKKVPEQWPYINPKAYYPIGEAANLVVVSRDTLRKDATQLNVINYSRNLKNNRIKFLGKDLIHYRDYVR